MSKSRLLQVVAVAALLVAPSLADAAVCMNKFVSRSEGANRKIVTLLTGMLTFQEADALSKAIAANQAPALEWVDDNGKLIARQFGAMKVVRPMPVACESRSSGSVVIVTFLTGNTPMRKMRVKLNANTTV